MYIQKYTKSIYLFFEHITRYFISDDKRSSNEMKSFSTPSLSVLQGYRMCYNGELCVLKGTFNVEIFLNILSHSYSDIILGHPDKIGGS